MLVVRCALTLQEANDDRCKTAIFHSYAKCGKKSCKVIIDGGSCTNVVSSKAVTHLGLSLGPHLQAYRVSRMDHTSIPVAQRYLVPI